MIVIMAGQLYEYKIILLGEAGVGKTSLFTRIKTGRFNPDQTTDIGTQGTDVYVYHTSVGDDFLSVALWDTAGGERFRTLTNNFYRNTDGVLLVYSGEDLYTFDNLQGWISDASQHIATCEWALIGNKNDLHNEIEKSRIEKFCEAYPTKSFYSTSAKTGENVLKAFKSLISAIHRKHVKHSSPRLSPKNNTIVDTVNVGAATAGKQNRVDSNCCS